MPKALCVFLGLISGFFILVYAEARSSYPPELTGRGMTALNMSIFLGAAVAQSLSGVIAGRRTKGRVERNRCRFALPVGVAACGHVLLFHTNSRRQTSRPLAGKCKPIPLKSAIAIDDRFTLNP